MTERFAPTTRTAARPTAFALAFGVMIVDGVGLGLLLPLLPFFAMSFSADAAQVTLLVALYSLAGFVGEPLLGRLSDRFGASRIVLWSLLGSVLTYLGLLFATSLLAVFAFRVLGGALAGRGSVLRAMVTDGEDRQTQVRRLSWLASATAIGTALGPVLASATSLVSHSEHQFRNTILLAIALCSAGALCAALLPARRAIPAAPARTTSPPLGAMVWRLRLPLLLAATTSLGYAVLVSLTAVFANAQYGWTMVETGWLLTGMALVVTLGRFVALPRMTALWGQERTLAALIAVAAPALLAMGFAPTPMLFVAAALVFSGSCALATVIPSALVAAIAPNEHRGYAMGLTGAAAALATFVSASANGALFERAGYFAPHLLGAAALVVGFAALAAPRRQRPD